MTNSNVDGSNPENKALVNSGTMEDGNGSRYDWLRLTNTKTLFADEVDASNRMVSHLIKEALNGA